MKWPISRVPQSERFSEYEVEVTRRDTAKTWIGSYGGTPVLDPEGHLFLAVLTLPDVTERKRIQAALVESGAKFRQLADTIPQLAWMAKAADSCRCTAAAPFAVTPYERPMRTSAPMFLASLRATVTRRVTESKSARAHCADCRVTMGTYPTSKPLGGATSRPGSRFTSAPSFGGAM